MNTNRSLRLMRLAGLVLVMAGLGASLANAQTGGGKFNLPFAVRWGLAVLPPGNYTFTVNTDGLPANSVVVRGEDLRARIIVSSGYDDSFSGKDELIVERQGEGGTVRTLRLADVGLVLYFPAPKPERQILAQAPVLTERLPILMAKK